MSWQDPFRKRRLLYGTGSAMAVALVVGILVVATLLANRYHFRWDATRGQIQSLAAVTQALVSQVNKPLTMTAFSPEGTGDRQNIKDLLERYVYANRLISYQFVDPERQPLKAREGGYRTPGNILLEYEGRRQMASSPDEEAVTNALRKILHPEQKKLYFLAGHGERDLTDSKGGGLQVARRALENEGYEVKVLNLLNQEKVPQDAAVVVVASPRKPVLAAEIAALKGYLTRGGRLLVMLEAFQDGGLKEFLAGYGVGLDDGIILDVNQVSQALGVSAVMPLVVQYGPSPITEKFQNLVTIFPLARPLTLKQEVKGVTLLPLATTTDSSWEKMGRQWLKSGKGDYDPKADRKGPFTLAAQAEITLAPPKGGKEKAQSQAAENPEDHKTYLVAFGDVDFAANAYFNLFGNGDLFLNTLNFLAREKKQITIRQQDRKAQPLSLTGWQAWGLFITSLVWGPLVMLGAGIWAYRRRRTRR